MINPGFAYYNYFGEDIFYDYGFTNNQLNGAIAGVKWKAGGDTIARAYGFAYDNANRLSKADFSQNIRNTTTWNNTTVDFSVSNLTYDGGSNILTMKQRGLLIGSSTTIDSLTYTYLANSNQLQKVADAITDASQLGDFKDSALATDYTYDVNGNITKDYNRHMHTIANGNGAVYNLLDKPDSMVIANKATFYYYYDAAGAKLRKQVNDYSHGATIIKNYLYIDGFVYLNDTLQYVQQEEGRIRWAQKRNNSNGTIYYAFEYDYYLRDHLNNVRAVLTEGKDTATYAATMETADSATVQKLFSNVYDPVRTVAAKPAAFDSDPNNHFVSKLTGSTGGRIGPSIILKVMAGDKVQINTYAYYNGTVQTPVSDNTLLTDLLTTLVSGITNQSGGKIAGGNATQLTNTVSPNVLSFLNNRTYSSSLPKAYLNWVLLDNQFKFVAGNMGAKQVIAGSSKQALVVPLQTIAKNGYLYVYLSNQSPQDVYFDDLIVTHTTGPLLQEQSYYPFGLQMAGISDKALLKQDSKNKFNGGVELEEDYGVNLYSTFYRNYDPQIGRFGGVDVLAESSASTTPYHFSGNNPVSYNDPSGAMRDHTVQQGYNQTAPYLFWGLTHVNDIRHGRNMDDVENIQNGFTSAFFVNPYDGGGGGIIPGTNYLRDGGDYSSFWNPVIKAVQKEYNFIPGLSQPQLKTFYNYTNLSGSGIFETPNLDGLISYAAGEDYYLSGSFTKTSYEVSGNYGRGNNAWETVHEFIHWTEFTFTAGEVSNASRTFGRFGGDAYWVGENLQIINKVSHANFYGNQFTGSRNAISEFAEGMGKVAKPLGVITSIVSLGHAVYDVSQGKYEEAGIQLLDATMGTFGTFGGPVGWAVSGAYFISRIWWGNDNE